MSFVNKPLTDILDCVRASTATYVDPTGKIRTAGVDEPRIDFSGNGVGKLLVEEQRTNLIEWSQDFTPETKQPLRVEMTVVEMNTPIVGLNHAAYLSGNGDNLYCAVRNLNEDNVIGDKSHFAIVKDGGAGFATLRHGGSNGPRSSFNLITGEVVSDTSGATSSYIHALSDGWFLIGNSFTQDDLVNPATYVGPSIDGTHRGYIDSSRGIYVAAMQREVGSTPSSYIPTQTSAVTRAADNVSRVLGDEFNPFELTWTFEGRLLSGTGSQQFIALHSLTSASGLSSIVYTIFWDKTGERIRARVYNPDNTPSGMSVNDDFGYVTGDYVKIAASYSKQSRELRLSVNGSIIGAVSYDVTSSVSEITTQLVCSGLRDFWDQGQTSSEVAKVKYFPKALSLSELQEITKL